MRIAYHVMSAPGPLGLLFLARGDRGLRYLEFLDKRSIKRTIESRRAANPGATWEASLIDLKEYVDQLEGYFCGARMEFGLPLDPQGSEFEMQVWRELQQIPYGETRTYGQIAKAIQQPNASRAVGLANNQNPLAILIPCHRVIGADGSLTGYGGGLPRKRWLLSHETHFGALAGVTMDLFAATGSLPNTRIASGDGPPLGTLRRSAATTTREEAPRMVAKAMAARPVIAKTAAAKPVVAKSAVARAAVARVAAVKPVVAKAATARAVAAKAAPARTAAKPRTKPATRAGTKPATRAARSPRRTAR